jgi:hypothetical protein
MYSRFIKWKPCLLLLSIFFVPIFSFSYGQSSENYVLKTSKISSGSIPEQTSQNYQAAVTMGQNISSPLLESSNFQMKSGINVIIHSVMTEVKLKNELKIPNEYLLHQNYPNPFNPETTIRFDVKEQTNVQLKVYDILGRQVGTLVDQMLQAGAYKVTFEAQYLPSGIYYYRIEMMNFDDVKKMILLE